jgi:hypothetical protein
MLNITKSSQYTNNPNSVYIENTENAGYGVWFYNISQCSVVLRPKFDLVSNVKTYTGDYLLSVNGVMFEGNIEQTEINGNIQTGVGYEDFSKGLESIFTSAN